MDTQPREAGFWKPLAVGTGEGGGVQCRLCSHFCVIPAGGRGICGVRQNQAGRLVSLVSRLPAAISVDPVEKKPLYHFLPGTRTFSFGTMSFVAGIIFFALTWIGVKGLALLENKVRIAGYTRQGAV